MVCHITLSISDSVYRSSSNCLDFVAADGMQVINRDLWRCCISSISHEIDSPLFISIRYFKKCGKYINIVRGYATAFCLSSFTTNILMFRSFICRESQRHLDYSSHVIKIKPIRILKWSLLHNSFVPLKNYIAGKMNGAMERKNTSDSKHSDEINTHYRHSLITNNWVRH